MAVVYQIGRRGARVCTKKFSWGVEDVANVEVLPVPMLPMANGAGAEARWDLRAWKPATPMKLATPNEGGRGARSIRSQAIGALYFLALEILENIPLEQSWPAEERVLRFRHAFAVQQPALNERRRAYKIGDLKQFVVLRSDITGKFNHVADICRKRLV